MKGTYFDINYELDPSEVLKSFSDITESGGKGYVCVADGNIVQMVHRDPNYGKVVNGALFSICDSSWIPLFLKSLYGIKVPQYCGSSIFEDVVGLKRYRQYFLGTSKEILEPLRENLAVRDPAVVGMTFQELPFRAVEDFDYESIAAEINADSPDVIWVALGAPKQELFMSRLSPLLDRGIMVGVGAVFNFYSGAGEKRAPAWMVKGHLEWLYRIFQNPGKQLKRCSNIIRNYPAIYRKEKRKRI